MDLENKQDIAGFLGVHLEFDLLDGYLKLSQIGIDQTNHWHSGN